MVSRSRTLHFVALLAPLSALAAPSLSAQGELRSFEQDANRDDGETSHHRERSDHRGGWRFGEDFISDVFDALVVEGGACSWLRVAGDEDGMYPVPARQLGEPLIPFLRLDVSYQDVVGDVDAVSVRGEVGYGPIGFHVDSTKFREKSPADDLRLRRVMGLYRMSLGSVVETDLGFGVQTLHGESTTSRPVFALPVLVHPSEHWGLEYRPAWAGRVTDQDFALMLHVGSGSLEVGYRWLGTPHESLDGPYVGFSVRL